MPEAIEGLSAKDFAGSPVETAFKAHTRDAKAYDQDISDEEMRSISAKTMVIAGDANGVKRWRR